MVDGSNPDTSPSKWVIRTTVFWIIFILTAAIIFANPLRPLYFFLTLVFVEELPLPDWILISSIMAGIAVGAVTAFGSRPIRERNASYLSSTTVFVSVFMATSAVSAAMITTHEREQAVRIFKADQVELRSFWKSLRRDSENFAYAHAVAIKDCNPYIWSYRTMEFHSLNQNIAKNVLPNEWVRQCKITAD